MNINNTTEGVYRRCGCTDPVKGRRYGGRCPRLADPRHGSWYFAVQILTAGGQHRRVRRGGYRTAALAAAARDRMLAASSSIGVVGYGWTVARWLRHWLTKLPLQVRPSTVAAYRAHVERYLIPLLGRRALAELTVGHVEVMFTAIAAHRTRDGRPVTAATLQRIRATLRRALNVAIREQLLHDNVARLVVLPRPAHHRPQPWTSARIAAGNTMGTARSWRSGHRTTWPRF